MGRITGASVLVALTFLLVGCETAQQKAQRIEVERQQQAQAQAQQAQRIEVERQQQAQAQAQQAQRVEVERQQQAQAQAQQAEEERARQAAEAERKLREELGDEIAVNVKHWAGAGENVQEVAMFGHHRSTSLLLSRVLNKASDSKSQIHRCS